MLISPPFLVTRQADQSEDDWLNAAMTGGQPGDGAYPVSQNLGWHGGLHLTAPTEGDTVLPVRAIANGTVVYVRQPTAPVADPDHALNYGGGWTHDGVVVIRHETEIGEGADAQVTFFSIYVHLSSIHADVALNQPIYRKAEVGAAGQVYGSTDRKLHLEIACDDTHLSRLVGRASGELNTGADGRTQVVFGEIYVRVPAGAAVFAQRPDANQTQPAAAPVHTTTEDLFVGIRYSDGHGLAGNRGDAYVTTYLVDGSVVGTTLEEDAAEYGLYQEAIRISDAYPAAGRPIRSAVYELLRFGRVIGGDTLDPADTPHWRRIHYPGGQGWVNLSATGTTKYSDADFPHWRGWTLVDDSTDQDSRCDSATIRRWLDVDGNGQVEPSEAMVRLSQADIAARMAKVVCKFATEWNDATIDARWGWLKTASPENPTPMNDEAFDLLKAHVTALCFWGAAGLALPESHWRFNPREFIRTFRRCAWFSARELAHCLPRTRSLADGSDANLSWAQAQQRANNHVASVNLLMRKYLGANPQRQTHALAQVYIETNLLATMTEYGTGNNHAYGAFYGRGLMQLTWPINYASYGRYKGLANQAAPATYVDARITATSTHVWQAAATPQVWAPRYDPQVVGTQSVHSAESGGFYWVSKTFRGTRNINRACDEGLNGNHVGFISWLVNGGGNGYRERQGFMRFVRNVLLDEVPLTGTEQWAYPPLVNTLTAAFPPGNPPATANITVHYAPQVP
ncbi:hypothetical protein [Myxococcus sp. Y35]|uniref:hypothetical protein n=1 Tax=Pseudomyxococcus flavus TaxID=3115648 RepID=UPI003CE68A78